MSRSPALQTCLAPVQGWRSRLPRVLAVLLLGLLSACTTRPGPEVLMPHAVAQPEGATIQRVYMATTRGRTPGDSNTFGNSRVQQISYGVFDISIPPTHRTATIEWPDRTPDPRTDFVTVGRADYQARAFNQSITAGRGTTNVALYVHGFNNNLQESVYRTAQIAHDSGSSEAAVLFAWPSIGRALGYVADREAADFSRAALAQVIADLAANPRAGRIMIVGHSMGARLVMESLMQLALADRRDVLDRVEVLLANPDIDVDVFLEQARIVGPMQPPLMVMAATDDRALRVSHALAGGRGRLGKIDVRNPVVQRRVAELGVRVVDFTALPTDALAHNRIVQAAAMYEQLPASESQPSLRGAGVFVFGTVGAGIARIGQALEEP